MGSMPGEHGDQGGSTVSLHPSPDHTIRARRLVAYQDPGLPTRQGVREAHPSQAPHIIGVAMDAWEPGSDDGDAVRVAARQGVVVDVWCRGPIGQGAVLTSAVDGAAIDLGGFRGEVVAGVMAGDPMPAGVEGLRPVLLGIWRAEGPQQPADTWMTKDVAWRDAHEAWELA